MLTNAFIGRAEQPTEEELGAALGAAKPVWDRLLRELAEEHELVTREWNSYSPKAGWAMRLKRKARNIVYLSPGCGGFTVSFILGDRALAAARASRLPARLAQAMEGAQRYPEGTLIRLDVKSPKDLPGIKKLTAAKLEH